MNICVATEFVLRMVPLCLRTKLTRCRNSEDHTLKHNLNERLKITILVGLSQFSKCKKNY